MRHLMRTVNHDARGQDLNPRKGSPPTVETMSQRHLCADGGQVSNTAIYSAQLHYFI